MVACNQEVISAMIYAVAFAGFWVSCWGCATWQASLGLSWMEEEALLSRSTPEYVP
jgi:hypothetical protein